MLPEELEKEMERYTIRDFADIVRALRDHPVWREELRKLILGTEWENVPKKLDELERRVAHIEQDVAILKQDVAVLKQDVAVLKQDVTVLKQDVATLKQDVAVLKQEVAVLKQDVATLKQDVATLKQEVAVLKQEVTVLKQDVATLKQDVGVLKQDVEKLKGDVNYLKGEFGRFKGRDFERSVKDRCASIFGKFLRRTRCVYPDALIDLIDDAVDEGRIDIKDREKLLNLDLVVKGIDQNTNEKTAFAVEISYALYPTDVERVLDRTPLLQRIFDETVHPVIVSSEISEEARQLAIARGIRIIQYEY